MRFEWMVARRYLRSPHRPAVLQLVTLLSVLGVAAGVATLVIALAMDTGFDQTIQDRLLGGTAHVNSEYPWRGWNFGLSRIGSETRANSWSAFGNSRSL